MSGLFGGGGGGGGTPAPSPVVPAPSVAGDSAAERERRRRIGRAALVASDQRGTLSATTGRNVLTAV